MKRAALVATIPAVMALSAQLSAQQRVEPVPPPQPAPPPVVYQTPPDAEATRDLLHDLLRQFPPNLGEVLRFDHSLLSRADYVAAYPQLVQFLQQHPEVARNPEFYLGSYSYEPRRDRMPPEIEAIGVLLAGMAGFLGVSAFLGLVTWLVRAVIQHRRWLTTSKMQAEIHTRLMDRMTTNEELLAYIQSPAGRRFLESAPIRPEPETPQLAAPIGPIIWSMMAGIVFATVGAGFRIAAASVTDQAQQAFTVVGVVILMLGAGFIIASIFAYLVSARMGLFPGRAAASSSAGNA